MAYEDKGSRRRRRALGQLIVLAFSCTRAGISFALALCTPVCLLLSCSLLLGNTLFEATIPLSVTIIMTQFGLLTKIIRAYIIKE